MRNKLSISFGKGSRFLVKLTLFGPFIVYFLMFSCQIVARSPEIPPPESGPSPTAMIASDARNEGTTATATKTSVEEVKSTQQMLENFIAATPPNRSVESDGHTKAFNYLKARFEEISKNHSNSQVSVHDFVPDVDFAIKSYEKDFQELIASKHKPEEAVYKKWRAFTDRAIEFVGKFRGKVGKNIVLTLYGKRSPLEILYVGAHYDTIKHDHDTLQFDLSGTAPGADDNASGVIALLKAAEHFSKNPVDKTIRFISFDFEEIFFLGSYAFAKDLSAKNDKNEYQTGLLNFEMIGWSKSNVDTKPIMKLYTRTVDKTGFEKDFFLANTFKEYAETANLKIQPRIQKNGFNRSDNWSFWQKNYAAICITQDWEEDFNSANYHTDHDLPANLNYPYMNEIIKAAIGTIQILSTLDEPPDSSEETN